MLKTMKGSELSLLLKMLPQLNDHYRQNPRSLLAKIYGVFTVRASFDSEKREHHILLMENAAQLRDASQLELVFDLKGSMANRFVADRKDAGSTLKDQNFLQQWKDSV